MEPEHSTICADNPASSSPAGASKGWSEASSKKPQKRKSQESTSKEKKAKKKKPKLSRPTRLNYTVQEGEDMILIISNNDQFDGLSTTKRKWKKVVKGKGKAKGSKTKSKNKMKSKKVPNVMQSQCKVRPDSNPIKAPTKKEEDGLDRWGQSLPEEVLANIFQLVVYQEGAIPFLCRMSRVCQLWNAAAARPALWRTVSLGFCWIEPGRAQLPKTELKIRDTVNWLTENRFSQLQHFSLNHWKKQVDYVVEVVSQSCPHLQSLKLSHCSGVTTKSFQSIGDHCRALKSINVQHSEFQVEGLVSFLESHGSQIREILFTHGMKSDKLLVTICKGCCPGLELLEISTKLDSGYCQLPICTQALQNGCPKLQTFRMMNVIPLQKSLRRGPDSVDFPEVGFPLLEELSLATASMSSMRDQDLESILYGSSKLRVLDLRGCYGITTAGLFALPCEELHCLFWGMYVSSNNKVSLSSSKKGLHLLTQKWGSTLREMDISNQPFSEEDLEIAMGHLAQGAAETLRSLNLSGTKITTPALRLIIGHATALNYLNLSSCRYVPRGFKRAYRGQEEIRQLLDNLE